MVAYDIALALLWRSGERVGTMTMEQLSEIGWPAAVVIVGCAWAFVAFMKILLDKL